MIKRRLSIITATLIILTVMTQTLQSVGAKEIGSDVADPYPTALSVAGTETEPTGSVDHSNENDTGSMSSAEPEPTEGTGADEISAEADRVYRLLDGVPANGFFREDGSNYFYRDGRRVEHNWYRTGRYQQLYNRSQWLYELMKYSGETPECSSNNGKAVFDLAEKRGIIRDEADHYGPVDRLFAANTLVKALDYPNRKVGTVSDSIDAGLSTAAYYGYFIPDDEDKLYPNALVTEEEFDVIISELKLCQVLRGKKLTVFGDSIMYGFGNQVGGAYEGIAEIIGEKYGMDYKKYAKSGSVMGITEGKSHIADQIRSAVSADRESDLIILNGGTNDAWHNDISLGSINDGFDMSSIDEASYTNGFEKSMWLIRSKWKDTPVIYVRSHRMKLGTKARQEIIGETALALCEKWNVAGIDLYNESELNGNILKMAQRYTKDNDTRDRGIHPNALGYAKYYLSPIGENLASLFGMTMIGDCNGDGEVNVIDVYYLQRFNASLSLDVDIDTMMNGDVDHNGKLSIIDASYIQRGLVGLDITPYRIGETLSSA